MKQSFLFKRDKYWHIEYFDEIEKRTKRISTKCKMKSDALRFLNEFSEQKESELEVKHISLDQFIQEYQDYVKHNLSIKYFNDVRTTFYRIKETFGDIPLSKINSYQLEQFLTTTYKTSKYAAKHHFNNLRSAFNKAAQWGYLSMSPMQKIKAPKVPKNNPSFLNEIQLQQIIGKETNETLKDIYCFAFFTGMRLAEIAYLKWNQISLMERNIRVMNTEEFTTKGQRERTIPMSSRVNELLEKKFPKIINIQNEGYVFTMNGRRFNPDYISKFFKKAIRAAAKENPLDSSIHFHDLRHSFASNLAQKGVSLYVIKELLGHTDIKTTMIYAHLQPENLRNAVELL